MAEPRAATALELDAFRAEADVFIAEREEEEYRHLAGLKPTLELEPIYERHAALASRDSAVALGAAVDGDRRIRELWRFACEGYLGRATSDQTERAARLEAELTVNASGRTIPFRGILPALANEPDRARRERLERARNEATVEHLNPIHVEEAALTRGAVRELGAAGYVDLYRRFGFPLDELAHQCESLLDETEALYEQAAGRLFRSRLGLSLDEVERWDIPRAFRAPEWDVAFPSRGMVPALQATLTDLGIDLRAQRNVELDLEPRPTKSPRAFCAPIEVPDRIILVVSPIGGFDDWGALFHEAGHAEHFASTSPDLPVEHRRLGDDAVTEGWAALFEGLVGDAAWLGRRLDVPRPWDLVAEHAAEDLLRLRVGCARLLYALELHAADDPEAMAPRFVERMHEASKIEPSPADYLRAVDPGFYISAYLRSWAFEAQLRLFLHEEFGTTWFTRREAGSLLRDLWSEGQRLTADELLKDVAGMTLDLAAVPERIAQAL